MITVNTALETYRKEKTRHRHENEMSLELETEISDDVLESIALDDLLKKIQSLPTGYRIIFNLYAIEGYNHREIGEKLNISSGTSKSQYARAKKVLQELISKEREIEQKLLRNAK